MSKRKPKTVPSSRGGHDDVTGRPNRAPGASPVPEVDFHTLQAYRNWLLANGSKHFRHPSKRVTAGVPGDTTRVTRIAESPALCRLLQSIGHPAKVPAAPPNGVTASSTTDAAFSLSDASSLINEYLGYGETVSDQMRYVERKRIERRGRAEERDVFKERVFVSRRTRTGRQPLADPPQQTPPAKSVPTKSLKFPPETPPKLR
jgi:hypothetical protein